MDTLNIVRWNMRQHLWLCFVLAGLLLAACAAHDEDDSNNDLGGKNVIDEEEKSAKLDYIPPPFQTPMVSGSPLLVDWFSNRNAIGRKWFISKGKKDNVEDSIAKFNGQWEIGTPSTVVIDNDFGLIVKSRARHHAIASKFSRPFKFDGKPLIVQYEVKYEEGQECGGGYLKLLTEGIEALEEFTDKTPYTIMFGPDKCGAKSSILFIVRFRNPKNGTVSEHHAKQPSKPVSTYFDDHKTHLYTLIVRPDETFTVLVDESKLISGSLITDLEPSITPPTVIDDPTDKKPETWDEREKIDDPDAKKPDDWDENAPRKIEDVNAVMPDDWLEEEEALIPDPEATKPSDWDDSMDGEWEAPRVDNPKCKDRSGCGKWTKPMVDNPNYKGKWKPPRITNPNYKGKWKPKQIENPNYFEPHPYSQLQPIIALGIELWTMSTNIIFDNIYVGDDENAASNFAKQTFKIKLAQETAYENASSPSQGIFSKLVSATEERPWLWVIYVLFILIPVVIIAVIYFGRKSRAVTLDYKKTDESHPDDEVPDLVGDDDESMERSSQEPEAHDDNTKEKKRTLSRSPNRVYVEEEASSSEEFKNEGHNSPKMRRVRQRKQD
ncbi:Uncharacterized protein BM_BM13750 [Brugia malayi]|uniref:BMA-CNX-1, isoform b n=2 Tax=Brugia malayi TaxID=6279 RepID=A0A4E9F4B0_BRUMA|nr:Uncharacterized protein BM_BM13750 [Brugia malayi]VIO91633.1 Uncharacterized protein BM_BM13750 [Brugia malayi]